MFWVLASLKFLSDSELSLFAIFVICLIPFLLIFYIIGWKKVNILKKDRPSKVKLILKRIWLNKLYLFIFIGLLAGVVFFYYKNEI